MLNVTICVATFGDPEWQALAESRAVPSAQSQAPVVRYHGESLHEARNACLEMVRSEWIVYLDADDELEPGYVTAMEKGSADVRGPMLRFIRNGHPRLWQPRVAGHKHDCSTDCMPQGNFMAIGACVRADLLREVGGFEPWPVYEDWALFLRCWKAGASFELVPGAIYRAHVNRGSRNRAPSMAEKNRVHHEIVAAVLGDRVAA